MHPPALWASGFYHLLPNINRSPVFSLTVPVVFTAYSAAKFLCFYPGPYWLKVFTAILTTKSHMYFISTSCRRTLAAKPLPIPDMRLWRVYGQTLRVFAYLLLYDFIHANFPLLILRRNLLYLSQYPSATLPFGKTVHKSSSSG
jgi:hypothetical protein